MSARDKAIACMGVPVCTIERKQADGGWYATEESRADMLDKIPAGVLIDLAIERGGLVKVDLGATAQAADYYRRTIDDGETR